MKSGSISAERILSKLDDYLHHNDYAAAERHLLYWLAEAEASLDARTELLVRNELMGLYRKQGKEQEALSTVSAALKKIEALQIGHQVGAATTYLNGATVYKAFSMAEQALPLFEKAKEVYERELAEGDERLGGLYNNMALALVDLGRFREAEKMYRRAIAIMERTEHGALEVAITHLNMASAAEAEHGLLEADAAITAHLQQAEALLEGHQKRDGYYAFVCEKCASVFGFYGYFHYENELKERAKRIYEGA